jgi:hypothetical protein
MAQISPFIFSLDNYVEAQKSTSHPPTTEKNLLPMPKLRWHYSHNSSFYSDSHNARHFGEMLLRSFVFSRRRKIVEGSE